MIRDQTKTSTLFLDVSVLRDEDKEGSMCRDGLRICRFQFQPIIRHGFFFSLINSASTTEDKLMVVCWKENQHIIGFPWHMIAPHKQRFLT